MMYTVPLNMMESLPGLLSRLVCRRGDDGLTLSASQKPKPFLAKCIKESHVLANDLEIWGMKIQMDISYITTLKQNTFNFCSK